MLHDIFCAVAIVIGSLFMLIAGIGLVRFPDLYLRMSATTKAATFGVGFSLLAAALHFYDWGISTRALATIVFIFISAPVAAHIVGRAAYLNRVPLWKNTLCDELEGRYDVKSHRLANAEQAVRNPSERVIGGKNISE